MSKTHKVMLYSAVCLLAVMLVTAANADGVARVGRSQGMTWLDVTWEWLGSDAEELASPITEVRVALRSGRVQNAVGPAGWVAYLHPELGDQGVQWLYEGDTFVPPIGTSVGPADGSEIDPLSPPDPVTLSGFGIKVSGSGRATWETYSDDGFRNAYITILKLKGKQ